MDIKDYDPIIDIVEENVKLSPGEILEKIYNNFRIYGRDYEQRVIGLFSSINPDGYSIMDYLQERRYLRALEACASGRTKEEVCEEYGLDPSNLYREAKKRCNKTILELRDDNYFCPPPLHLAEILDYKKIQSDKQLKNEGLYTSEIKELIDENCSLKKELEKERIKSLNKAKHEKSNFAISYDMYEHFLKIDNLRTIYGFSVDDMLQTYEEWRSKWQSKGISLEKVCDMRWEIKHFEVVKDGNDELYNDNPEWEMELGDYWDYYHEDDDPADSPHDPYAPSVEDLIFDKEEREDEYENRLLSEEEEYEEDEHIEETEEQEIEDIIEQLDNDWKQSKELKKTLGIKENKNDEKDDEDIWF